MTAIRTAAKRPKYGNKKTVFAGLKFDSAREAKRYGELLILQEMGKIRGLARQVPYELAQAVKFPDEKRTKPAIKYWADFRYYEEYGDNMVVEDVKSPVTQKTAAFRMKRHLMLTVHGIVVRIV